MSVLLSLYYDNGIAYTDNYNYNQGIIAHHILLLNLQQGMSEYSHAYQKISALLSLYPIDNGMAHTDIATIEASQK